MRDDCQLKKKKKKRFSRKKVFKSTFTVHSRDYVPVILLRIARQNECEKRMVIVNIKKCFFFKSCPGRTMHTLLSTEQDKIASEVKVSLTGKDLMVHSTALFSGTHLALPVLVLNLGESASLGTGTRITTLLAVERVLNWLRACRTPYTTLK